MKIGIDCHNLEKERTGVGRYLKNLLEEWSKFGIRNQESGIRNNLKFILYFHREIPNDEFLQSPLFEKKLLKIPYCRSSFLIYFLFLLPWALKKNRVDLAFFPCYMVPITYWGKSIIVLHDVIFKVYPHLFSWRYRIPYLLFSWWGVKKSKAIITVSEFSKNEIIKYYRADSKKIFVTPLGVEYQFRSMNVLRGRLAYEGPRRAFIGRYGIRGNFVLCLGQIFNRRNVDKVILAFRKIAPKHLELQLLIIGKNRTKPFLNIEKMIKEINIGFGREAILHKDYAPDEDLPLLYSGAKLTVYLSDYEGFGLPPLESMACGTPVLTTNKTALKETVDGAAIIAENPDNVEEIAQKMEEGLVNENLRRDLVRKGCEQIQKFSWEKCAKETLRVLKSEIQNSNVKSA